MVVVRLGGSIQPYPTLYALIPLSPIEGTRKTIYDYCPNPMALGLEISKAT